MNDTSNEKKSEEYNPKDENLNKDKKEISSDEALKMDSSEEEELIEKKELEKMPSKNENRTEKTSDEELNIEIRSYRKNLIEAALYASGKALTIEEIATKLNLSKNEVEELVNELAYDYLDRNSALIINKVGQGFHLTLKSEYIETVSDFATGGAIAEKYLRTLTVIALKQPILKSLLVKLRGSGAYEHVKYLKREGLIDSVKKGRSSELTTTEKYAEMFGLPKDIHAMKKVMIEQLGIEEKENKED
ncbi:MAG: SMC-Scp complex subunit ScpB [Candidatus Lokiarchaeota archaeon]|nr:SMC-Scp complex subunit ScpB [Candidatus Lokiarchaeota archaeon]MBD3338964.1 SMC-Scp complex subunit ScpB [Candidatus Lokiarchaeota archaeon]